MTTYAQWRSPSWLATATGWLDTTLSAAGRTRTGPVEQPRVRPWGTVLTARTDAGPVWLKAPSPSLRFELSLLDALAGLGLSGAPRVIGSDPGLGTVLLEDAGRSYRERWPDDAELARHLAAAWPMVGRLQRAAAPLVPDLVAGGVVDCRPDALPARFDEVLERARQAFGDPDDVDLLLRVAAARPRLLDVCAELGGSRVPASVDHNDVHQGNLAVDAHGRTTVLDWGDAVVAHPFATLLVAERVLRELTGADEPAVARARRDYLAIFADLAPGEDLDRTADLAVAVGQVGRAWVWQRALDTFVDVETFTPPPGWPRDFDRGPLTHLRHARDALAEPAG